MHKIAGRVAVVTGAAGGIGRATSLLLARNGCDLALADVNDAGLEATAALVRQAGRRVSLHIVDVADKEQMEAFPEDVIREHGHAHILVNNAGVAVSGTLEEQTLEDLEWIFAINFWGVVYGCKFFLPQLRREEEAHIVNISSMFGFIGLPGVSSYCATKAAVRAVSEALWAELRDTPIGVTSVHPGGVKTDIIRSSRGGDDPSRQRTVELFERFGIAPERVARKIIRAVKRDKPRTLVCAEAHLTDWAKRLFPVLSLRLVGRVYRSTGPIG